MHFEDRQANIDRFNINPEYGVFLLSTRAGGKYIPKQYLYVVVRLYSGNVTSGALFRVKFVGQKMI